jgi:MYXO-CTERM domain-containing protein
MTREFNLRLSAMAAAAAIVLAGGAQGADVLFTITETGETITFTVPKSPTTDISFSLSGFGFSLDPVNVIYNGSSNFGEEVTFFNSGLGGGAADYGSIFDLSGSQYYTRDEGSPTFVTGVYDDQFDYNTLYNTLQSATVNITDVSAAPEPAAWTLMLVGFGGLGGALRARRRTVAAA